MRRGGWCVAGSALILALLCGSAAARAEAQALSGLDRYDQYNGVAGDGSGGFVVVGAQDTERPRESVARLRSFAADGTLRIDRTILPQGAASAALADAIRLGDGDIVATGWSQRTGATSDDCWVIRAAADGSTRWSRTTTDPAHERCYFVTALADGTVLIGGRSEADASGKAAAVGATWRADIRTGEIGAPVRTACGRPALRCAFQDAVALADSSLALVGWLTDPTRGDDDIWVVRRDAAGRETIRRRIGAPGADLANAVLAGPRDGILVVGYATQDGDDASHGVVMALDAAGEKAWTRQFRTGAAGNDKLLGALSLPDGKAVAVGAASQDAKAPFKGWLVEIGPNGETIRDHVFDQPPGGCFTAIAVSNGRLAGVGAARAADGIDTDGWIARLDLPQPPATTQTAEGLAAGSGSASQRVQQDVRTAPASVEWPMTIAPGGDAYGFRLTRAGRAYFGTQELFPDIRKDPTSVRIKISQPSPRHGYIYVTCWDDDWGGLQRHRLSPFRPGHARRRSTEFAGSRHGRSAESGWCETGVVPDLLVAAGNSWRYGLVWRPRRT